MALDAKLLTFDADTSGGGTQDLTGTSFTPKAAIVWYQRSINAVDTFTEHANMGFGFTDGSTNRCCHFVSEDNQTSSDASGEPSSNQLIFSNNPTGTLTNTDCAATFNSFLSNGMRISWSDYPAASFKIHVLFLGGSDLTNVKVGTALTSDASVGGSTGITGVGFQPDLLLFISKYLFEDTSTGGGNLAIGAAIDSSNQWAQDVSIEGGRSTTDTWQRYDHNDCMSIQIGSSGSLTYQASFTSMDSDGFTINETADGVSGCPIYYLALKGGSYAVGNATEPGSTGNQTVTTNKDCKAVMIFGVDTGTENSDESDCMLTIGAGTGSSERLCASLHDTDASADSVCVDYYESSSIYLNITANATASSSTIDDEADLNAVASDGFTLNWSNVGQARPFRYITFGSGGSTLFEEDITESAISVSDPLTRLYSCFRSSAESAINVSDPVTRLQSLFRSISETPIDVSEDASGYKFLPRSLSEAAIEITDDIQTFLAATRSLPETVAVSDQLTRILSAFRSISESTIDVSEQLERIKTQLRSSSESAIDVQDSLTTLTNLFRSISESTIDITDDVTAIKGQIRILTESAIAIIDDLTYLLTEVKNLSDTIGVSDQIARLTEQFRTTAESSISVMEDLDFNETSPRIITETAIAVSEQLTRSLDAFRSLADTISVSDFGSDGNTIVPQLAEFLSDPGYMNPLRTRIRFRSRTNPTLIYYNYDSFGPSARPFNILACSVRLAQGEVGSFTIDIEDSDETVNKHQIGFGTKVTVEVKKEVRHDYIPLCTGFVRRIRKIRSATGVLIWRVTGYSTQIVFNERVVNFRRAAKRESVDSPIPLLTDERMLAYRLAIDLITSTDILPLRKPTVQNSGGYQSLTGISDRVDDFIAQIAPGLTDATTVMNALAELTGAIWGTDENGEPYFRYPHAVHSGIIITDNPQDTDPATITSTNVDQFEYEDSIDQSEGFANRLYVLNAVDTKSTASSSSALGSTTLTIRGVAQQFTSTDNNVTGAAFILSKVGTPVPYDNTNVITGYLRADFNNFPTGATLATFEIPIDQITNAQETIFVNDIKTETGTINPGQKYWWVLIGRFNDDSNTVRWHHNNIQNNTSQPFSARLPLVDADPTQPGQQLNWQRNPAGPVYAFSTFSSVRHIITQSDADSIARYGLIEGIVDLPAFEDDDTFSKALVKILDTSAKPKRVYDYARVTIPTDKIFVPGQLVTVIDSKAKLTSEKNVTAEISEVSYTFDTNQNALGVKYVDIRLIGFIDETLDDYLDTTPCT